MKKKPLEMELFEKKMVQTFSLFDNKNDRNSNKKKKKQFKEKKS